MKEYFANNKGALNRPFVIRGFLSQPDTEFDLSKYADVAYLKENLQAGNSTYTFDSADKEVGDSLSFKKHAVHLTSSPACLRSAEDSRDERGP